MRKRRRPALNRDGQRREAMETRQALMRIEARLDHLEAMTGVVGDAFHGHPEDHLPERDPAGSGPPDRPDQHSGRTGNAAGSPAGNAADGRGALTLRDLSSQLTREFAVHADRLAAVHLKIDMTQSRVVRMGRVLDEMRQVQEEQSAILAEIEGRGPVEPDSDLSS
jgi:hypothetical protein